MGRKKIPTKLKIVKGTHRPWRENPNEPMPQNPLGNPPDCLNGKQKAVWQELSIIVPAGVLTDADRIIVEIAVRLISELREKGKLSSGKMGHLLNSLGRMGLSPSDRSKVSIQVKPTKDQWENF